MWRPDPLHRAQRHLGRRRHRLTAPVRRLAGRLSQRQRRRQRRQTRFSGLLAQHAGDTFVHQAPCGQIGIYVRV